MAVEAVSPLPTRFGILAGLLLMPALITNTFLRIERESVKYFRTFIINCKREINTHVEYDFYELLHFWLIAIYCQLTLADRYRLFVFSQLEFAILLHILVNFI